MLKRSPSGPRARLLRSSSSRNHQWKARTLAYLVVLIFLCTVAFLQAKPKFSPAAGHASRDPADSHGHLAVERVADVRQRRNHFGADERPHQTALDRSSRGEDSLWESDKDVETSLFGVSKHLDEQRAANDSFGSGLDEDDYEEGEEGNLQEDREVDVELETEELENLEDPRDTAVEGFDDMDDYELMEKDELEEQTDMKGTKIGAGVNFGVELKEADQLGTHASEDSLPAAGGTVNTSETAREDGMRNSSRDLESGINRRFYRRFGTEKNYSGSDKKALNDTQILQRRSSVEDLGSGGKAAHTPARRSLAQTHQKKANNEKGGIIWDHLLGVARRTHEFKNTKIPSVARKCKLGAVEENRMVCVGERQDGFFNVSSASNTQIFSSDDEPLEQDLRVRLEAVTAIEDALLLRTDKGSLSNGLLRSWINSSGKKAKKGRTNKNQQLSKSSLDPLNPVNNPLLQDPDTLGSNGLTSGDNALRKALLKSSIEEFSTFQRN